VWELYHLASDRTQLRNVAAEHPELLERLKGLWFYYAGVYRGLPLDDRTALEILRVRRPQPGVSRDRYVYYPDTAAMPEASAVNLARRSFGIAAGVAIDSPDAEGVLLAYGGVAGGLALYLQDRRLHFVYNCVGEKIQKVSSDAEILTGRHVLTAAFEKTGDDPTGSAVGMLSLYVDTALASSLEIVTQPGVFGISDAVSVGRDSGSAVSPDYRPPFAFRGGTIDRVVVDVSGEEFVDHEKEVLAYIARD
jgi:arylsulfatase